MSSHTLAATFLVALLFQFLLAVVDEQPKPVWTKVYGLRFAVSLVTLTCVVLLALRAL